MRRIRRGREDHEKKPQEGMERRQKGKYKRGKGTGRSMGEHGEKEKGEREQIRSNKTSNVENVETAPLHI